MYRDHWRTFPLQPASKHPRRGLKWKQPFEGEWREGEGIGLHLGPSGVVDVDFDWPEATGYAQVFFPNDCTFGRRLNPEDETVHPTHVLVTAEIDKRIPFAVPKCIRERLNLEDDESMVMEIRAGDHYTMIPPSTHPNGTRLEHVNEIEPRPWDVDELRRAVGTIAFLSVLERFWGDGGSRHNCFLAAAAMLKRAGWDKSTALHALGLIYRAMGDNEEKDRRRAVEDTYKRDHVSGWGKLKEAFNLPDAFRPTVLKWLMLDSEVEIDPSTLEEFNKQYAVIRNQNKHGVLVRNVDPILRRVSYSVISQSGFLLIENSKEAAQWLQSSPPLRQTYPHGFVFDPENDHPGYFNLWQGLAVTPKAGDWSLMRRHIEEVIAREDPDYLIRWLAWCVQNPGKRAEVAIVMRGPKGSGKGSLASAMLSIFGQHGMHVSSTKHLVGNFNSHLQDCVFLFADESFWAGDREGEGNLKRMITEHTLTIERKGVDAAVSANALHVMIASNEDWVVPASTDHERRFAVYDVAAERQDDDAYFDELHRQMQNGGLEAMLFDLQQMDLGDWHPRRDVPKTDALHEQAKHSERPEVAALREILELGQCPGTRSDVNDPNELLFPDFKERVTGKAYGRNVTDVAMANAIKDRLRVIHADNNGTQFVTYSEKSGKPMTRRVKRYLLDDLEACRQAFDPKAKWPRDPSRWEWEAACEGENDVPPEVVKDPPF